jgi:hypothetical protein
MKFRINNALGTNARKRADIPRTIKGMNMIGQAGWTNDWVGTNISQGQEIHLHRRGAYILNNEEDDN